jgi:hypothetical protein
MPKERRQQTSPGARVRRARSASSQGRGEAQRGTTRRGGHSAYARYPHQQFAADRAAEAAKTHTTPRISK